MTTRLARVLAAAIVGGLSLIGSAALAADPVSITLPEDRTDLKPGPHHDVAVTQCRMCHSLDYVTMQPPGGEKQWDAVVTKMIKVFGAPIGEADARAIVEFLTGAYGPPK
jgi:hypothetical protein